MANCETCKRNEGTPGYPICKYEEIDERNNYTNITTKEMNTMYTEDCVRYEGK